MEVLKCLSSKRHRIKIHYFKKCIIHDLWFPDKFFTCESGIDFILNKILAEYMYFHRFDINSPDSGIHSDARSDDGSHVHGPVNEDIYSVVNKSSEPEGSEETTPTGVIQDLTIKH